MEVWKDLFGLSMLEALPMVASVMTMENENVAMLLESTIFTMDASRTVDLIVCDSIALGAVSVAHRFDIPLVASVTLPQSLLNEYYYVSHRFSATAAEGLPVPYPQTFFGRVQSCVARMIGRIVLYFGFHLRFSHLWKGASLKQHPHLLVYPSSLLPSQPLPAHVIHTGALHRGGGMTDQQVPSYRDQVPQDLLDWMDSRVVANDSITYVSLGTSYYYDKQLLNAFVDMLSQYQSPVLWVVVDETCAAEDFESLPAQISPNVLLRRWVPTLAVFRYLVEATVPTYAFTQCGVGVYADASYTGLPLLCLPLGADQYEISQRLRESGAGDFISKDDVISDGASRALAAMSNMLVHIGVFRRSAFQLQRVLQYERGLPEAMRIVNSILAAGSAFHIVGVEWAWYQVAGLDVMAFILVVGYVVVRIAFAGMKRSFVGSKEQSKSKRE